MTLLQAMPTWPTVKDLLKSLDDVPAERVRFYPLPGTATEHDVIEVHERQGRYCELVDGTLVEKAMGYEESLIAMNIVVVVATFVKKHKLGLVSGEGGMMRLFPGRVRIPDVAFVSKNQFPNRKVPNKPIPDLYPDLAIEVLSKSNTKREIARKIGEYFQVGGRLVWVVDPPKKMVAVYRSPTDVTKLNQSDSLTGGDVLPGLTLKVSDIFDIGID